MYIKEDNESDQFFSIDEEPETPHFFYTGSRTPSKASLRSFNAQSNKEIKNQNQTNTTDESLNSIAPKEEIYTLNNQRYVGDRIVGPECTFSEANLFLTSKNDEEEKIKIKTKNTINKRNYSKKIIIPDLESEKILDFKTGVVSEIKRKKNSNKNAKHLTLTKYSKSDENNNQNTIEIINSINQLSDNDIKEKNKINGGEIKLKNTNQKNRNMKKSNSTTKRIKDILEKNVKVIRTKTPTKQIKYDINTINSNENKLKNNTNKNVIYGVEKMNTGINTINLNESNDEMDIEIISVQSNINKNDINSQNIIKNKNSNQIEQIKKKDKEDEKYSHVNNSKKRNQEKNESNNHNFNNEQVNKKNNDKENRNDNNNDIVVKGEKDKEKEKIEIIEIKEEKDKIEKEKIEEIKGISRKEKIESVTKKNQRNQSEVKISNKSPNWKGLKPHKFLSPQKKNTIVNENQLSIINKHKLTNDNNKKNLQNLNKINNTINETNKINTNINLIDNRRNNTPNKLKKIELFSVFSPKNQLIWNNEALLNKKRKRSFSDIDYLENEEEEKTKYDYLMDNEIASYCKLKKDIILKETNLILYREEENSIIEYYCDEKKEKNEENDKIILCKCSDIYCDGFGILVFSENYSEKLSNEEKREEVKFILLVDHKLKSQFHRSNESDQKMTRFMKYCKKKEVLIKREGKSQTKFKAIMII